MRSKRQHERKKQRIRVVHNAPGKKGKQEHRFFVTHEEAIEYWKRNLDKRLK